MLGDSINYCDLLGLFILSGQVVPVQVLLFCSQNNLVGDVMMMIMMMTKTD